MTLLAGLGTRLAGWLAAAGALVLALLAVRRGGRDAARRETAERVATTARARARADARLPTLTDEELDRWLRPPR